MQHWKEGGHDKLCKLIKKAGGAEQYNANKKYTEAVAVAAEKCAEDTKGQTCYICTQALHWKTKEGLVRMCACRGTAGFAHVSCLAEQAKILMDEAEENKLGPKVLRERWDRWGICSLCEQEYHRLHFSAHLSPSKLFSSASAVKIFTSSTRHDTCAKPAVPRHAHMRTRPSLVFQCEALSLIHI